MTTTTTAPAPTSPPAHGSEPEDPTGRTWGPDRIPWAPVPAMGTRCPAKYLAGFLRIVGPCVVRRVGKGSLGREAVGVPLAHLEPVKSPAGISEAYTLRADAFGLVDAEGETLTAGPVRAEVEARKRTRSALAKLSASELSRLATVAGLDPGPDRVPNPGPATCDKCGHRAAVSDVGRTCASGTYQGTRCGWLAARDPAYVRGVYRETYATGTRSNPDGNRRARLVAVLAPVIVSKYRNE